MPRASEATPRVKARSLVTPCKGRSFIAIFNTECFCPYRASMLWQFVTQGVASLALVLCAVGLSARALLDAKPCRKKLRILNTLPVRGEIR